MLRKLKFYKNLVRITGTLHEDRYMYVYYNSLNTIWYEKCFRQKL